MRVHDATPRPFRTTPHRDRTLAHTSQRDRPARRRRRAAHRRAVSRQRAKHRRHRFQRDHSSTLAHERRESHARESNVRTDVDHRSTGARPAGVPVVTTSPKNFIVQKLHVRSRHVRHARAVRRRRRLPRVVERPRPPRRGANARRRARHPPFPRARTFSIVSSTTVHRRRRPSRESRARGRRHPSTRRTRARGRRARSSCAARTPVVV